MRVLKIKPSKRLFIYAVIVLFLTGAILLILSISKKAAEPSIPFTYSFSSTPTPCPLPNRVYQSSFSIVDFFEQIFGNRTQSIDPSLIKSGQQEAENTHFTLYSESNFLPVDIQWWQRESEKVYYYVSSRLKTTINEKVIVTFLPPQSGNCGPRGTTFHEQQPIIFIFANQTTSKEQVLATLAHELGHVFLHQEYPDLSDVALTEGMATWVAGEYWRDWKGADFNSGVRNFFSNGTYLPLYPNYDLRKAYDDKSPDCIAHRDILLTEFASFVDFLIQNYGAEKLSTLFDIRQPELVNNQRVVYAPNYRDVYGLEFNQLEYEWLKTLLEPGQ